MSKLKQTSHDREIDLKKLYSETIMHGCTIKVGNKCTSRITKKIHRMSLTRRTPNNNQHF